MFALRNKFNLEYSKKKNISKINNCLGVVLSILFTPVLVCFATKRELRSFIY